MSEEYSQAELAGFNTRPESSSLRLCYHGGIQHQLRPAEMPCHNYSTPGPSLPTNQFHAHSGWHSTWSASPLEPVPRPRFHRRQHKINNHRLIELPPSLVRPIRTNDCCINNIRRSLFCPHGWLSLQNHHALQTADSVR